MRLLDLACAAIAFALSAVLWTWGLRAWRHGDRTFSRIPNSFLAAEYRAGVDRSELVGAVGFFLFGLMLILGAAIGSNGIDAGMNPIAKWALGATGVSVMVSFGLVYAIIFYNRPRFLVPPSFRDELGVSVARRRDSGKRDSDHS